MLTSFIGRQHELEEIRQLLSQRRLVTLTGAGGSGKTRLALEVLSGVGDIFPDGVWWIELADLGEPDLLPEVVAAALGLRDSPGHGATDILSAFLHPRRSLLVLDNCEHLLETCAHLASHLLQSCPDLHLLTTSREALRLPGEIVRPMLPLEQPTPQSDLDLSALSKVEAVALFLDRATALTPAFALTERNARAVIQICNLLDGIPLAIELAAARVPVLSVHQIAARLDDSLRLLAVGPRLAQPRHQTMRTAIDWSYHLLSEQEQMLWRRLSVFRGPFSLAAIEAVCVLETDETASSVLDLLTQLVQKSLVLVTRGQSQTHYHVLEPLRQYASEKLAEGGETIIFHQRHCHYYLDWAERHETQLRGPDQAVFLVQFDTRYPNLRTALGWSLREPVESVNGMRLAVALGPYWLLRNMFTEARRWLDENLTRSEITTPTVFRGQVYYFASVFAWYQSDHPVAHKYVDKGHTIARALDFDGKWGIAYTLTMLGQVVRFQGEDQAALRYLQESVARFRRTGDQWGLAVALDSLCSVSRQVGDLEAAYTACHESQALWRAIGDPWGFALNRLEFFLQARAEGDHLKAMAVYEENRALLEVRGYSWHLAVMFMGLADLALNREDYAAAASYYSQYLDLTRQIGDEVREAAALCGLGTAYLAQGHLPEAFAHCKEGLLLFEKYRWSLFAETHFEQMAMVAESKGHELPAARIRSAITALRSAGMSDSDPPPDISGAYSEILSALQQITKTPNPSPRPILEGYPFDLTHRELEVLRLAAEGLTDPQIAERLVISKRTVSAHLHTIYSKLGVGTRTAATRLAIEHHLLDRQQDK